MFTLEQTMNLFWKFKVCPIWQVYVFVDGLIDFFIKVQKYLSNFIGKSCIAKGKLFCAQRTTKEIRRELSKK